ncbi:MAG: 2-oxoacid:ferredoxin oxidoreductase subunit gamma [Desulfobulbaceae bacterium]|nr:MAG: 2-oxoacid:ferredoxin oxidoreductase subunit gamma [Desulfobulbaceae bacterium]
MFCEKLICAGFGGQGIMSLGQTLAYSAMMEKKEVTWLPSYGPEMRGGTAYCCVMISDRPVGSPLITDDATTGIIMNAPSLVKFEQSLVSGGILLLNSSLIEQQPERDDIHIFPIDSVGEAEKCGNRRMANMIMLGAYIELTSMVSEPSVLKAFRKVFGSKAVGLNEICKAAIQRGRDIVHEHSPLPAAV